MNGWRGIDFVSIFLGNIFKISRVSTGMEATEISRQETTYEDGMESNQISLSRLCFIRSYIFVVFVSNANKARCIRQCWIIDFCLIEAERVASNIHSWKMTARWNYWRRVSRYLQCFIKGMESTKIECWHQSILNKPALQNPAGTI